MLSHFPNLIKLDIKDKNKLSTLNIRDYKSVLKYIDMIKPDAKNIDEIISALYTSQKEIYK